MFSNILFPLVALAAFLGICVIALGIGFFVLRRRFGKLERWYDSLRADSGSSSLEEILDDLVRTQEASRELKVLQTLTHDLQAQMQEDGQ